MKTFLQRTITFLGILFIFVLLLVMFLSFNLSSKKYIIDSNISDIYIGDSHIQLSVNDSLLTKSKNLGENSEAFYFSYYKIKKVLSVNPNIKKLYLGVSYHNLSNSYDDCIFGESSSVISQRYFFMLPVNEQLKYLYYNVKNPVYYRSIIRLGAGELLYKKNGTYFGAYSNDFEEASASIETMNDRLNEYFFCKNGKLKDFSLNQLFYLKEIILLCKNNNIDLILLNTPLHSYYRNKLPREYIEKYDAIIKEENLNLIDFSALSLNDDDYIFDGDHVSKKGANIMTTKLEKIISTN
jgi:hypothetical protein